MPTKKKAAFPAKEAERYYVWEMKVRDRTVPVRQAHREPLSLSAAKKLARRGATAGKHDYAVTASPRRKGAFTVTAQYEAGTGKNITKKVWG